MGDFFFMNSDEQKNEIRNREFSFKKFWGPNEYRPRVVFDRSSDMQCVYCGEVADSREHSPSKVFLKKPFPADLPVVPACKKCNNSFAQDELYTKAFLQFFEEYMYDNISVTVDLSRKEVRDAKDHMMSIIELKQIEIDPRITRILTKLAICHSVYELTEGFYSDIWQGVPETVSYTFRPYLTNDQIADWCDFVPLNDKILPMVGSRVFERINVIEATLKAVNDLSDLKVSFVVMDWSDIQDGQYRYVCWLEEGKIKVKIVIDEFLFAKVVFAPSK